jgi:hypothetical protein
MPMSTGGQNRIMIFGPKEDGPYLVEFRTAAAEALAISIPENRDRSRSPLSGTNALRAVRAGGDLTDQVGLATEVNCQPCPLSATTPPVRCSRGPEEPEDWGSPVRR